MNRTPPTIARLLVAAAAGLALAACNTTGMPSNPFAHAPPGADANAAATPGDDSTGSVGTPPPAAPLLPGDSGGAIGLGKTQYRAGQYALAEKTFRRAAAAHPGDLEAWLGLAAADDRLRRFDAADRAYGEAIAIAGPAPEILNNRGYSYLLRGDFKRARALLLEAQAKDPDNKFIANNLQLLEEGERKGKRLE
jgi:tetratricopeptide (TPR) repeat protein